MSGPDKRERNERVSAEAARLRRLAAATAGSLAATEEQVARTLDEAAAQRDGPDAARLRAKAEEARLAAAKERGLSQKYENDGVEPDRSPEPDA